MSELPSFCLSSREVAHHAVVRVAAQESSPVALPFVTRQAMRASDLAGFTPEGVASFARILRLAKDRRDQATVGAAFDRARVTP